MLKFNSDGKFTIMCFGDLHESPDYAGAGRKRYDDMISLHNAALDEFKPDLCVYMGDNCRVGKLDTPQAIASFRLNVAAFTKPVRERGIPFTSVFGNHCHDNGYEDLQLEIYQSFENCIMRNDAPGITGNSNFNEFVYSSDGKKPLFNLWFIDSNNLYSTEFVSKYDWVHTDQIKWYEKRAAEIKEMNGGKVMPAMVFQHQPVPEEYDLLRKARLWELPVAVRGCNLKSKNFYVKKRGVEGYLGEGPCSPDYNNGQFESWKKTGDVIGAVFGHDHMNEFAGTVDGIMLMQTQTAGFGAYTNGCRSAVRVITLNENDPWTFETQLKHFKEFGLKSQYLGPVFRTLTDRQSINLHIIRDTALALAGAAGIAYTIKKFGRR